jgi:hypothetical protein
MTSELSQQTPNFGTRPRQERQLHLPFGQPSLELVICAVNTSSLPGLRVKPPAGLVRT